MPSILAKLSLQLFIEKNTGREIIVVANKEKNPSIQCEVSECKYHANTTDYCTLDQILVSRKEEVSQNSADTECGSFISDSDKFY